MNSERQPVENKRKETDTFWYLVKGRREGGGRIWWKGLPRWPFNENAYFNKQFSIFWRNTKYHIRHLLHLTPLFFLFIRLYTEYDIENFEWSTFARCSRCLNVKRPFRSNIPFEIAFRSEQNNNTKTHPKRIWSDGHTRKKSAYAANGFSMLSLLMWSAFFSLFWAHIKFIS